MARMPLGSMVSVWFTLHVCVASSLTAHEGHESDGALDDFSAPIRNAFAEIYSSNKWLEEPIDKGGSRSVPAVRARRTFPVTRAH